MLLNLLSMFVVVPLISVDKELYGVYMVCVSLSIFLSYADIGFLGAGQKFAAESFAKKKMIEERQVVGFTAFVLFVFLLILSGVFLFLSFHPYLIINQLENSTNINVASSLLLILALFTPVTMLQRIVQIIFIIRLQDYIYQRINIVGNLIKILSVFYFFTGGNNNIVAYFLFTQCVNLVVALINIIVAEKQFSYGIFNLFQSIRFNKIIFKKTAPLALSMFFATVSWVLYYELDSLAIGFLFGAESVAVYGIGLTILTLIRSVLGVLYSPFIARLNHFEGVNDQQGLKKFLEKVIILYYPVIVIPLLSVVFMADAIVISWVGAEYEKSILILRLLVLCNILAFVSYPIGALLVVKQLLKKMYLINIIAPVVFWLGIFFVQSEFQELSFALFKLVVFFLVGLLYFRIAIDYLGNKFLFSIKRCTFALVPSVLLLVIYDLFVGQYLLSEKSFGSMIFLFVGIMIIVAVGYLMQFYTSVDFRNTVKLIWNTLKK